MCKATITGAIIDYQANLSEAVWAAEQILNGQRTVDVQNTEDCDDTRGLHRALDHHSDLWTKKHIQPPGGFSGEYIHRLKVRLKRFMFENEIEPAEKLETA